MSSPNLALIPNDASIPDPSCVVLKQRRRPSFVRRFHLRRDELSWPWIGGSNRRSKCPEQKPRKCRSDKRKKFQLVVIFNAVLIELAFISLVTY